MTDSERQMRMAAEDHHQVRMVAESIYHASLNQSLNSQRQIYTQSVRTPDTVNEVLISGMRYNGRMSNVRRFFCLFVTFDLLFTVLMWLICIMISGANVQTAFVQQIVHYQIKTSLFDIVMAAACRFTILILFYALLHMDHWCIVALSTASTCAFLLTKVFLYDWSQYSQPVLQVLIVLISFVLVWGEVWLFDIKVIPQETQARDWFQGFPNQERTPLLNPYVEVPALSNENTGHFYTPIDSPYSSDDEIEINRKRENVPSFSTTIAQKIPRDKIDDCRNRAPSLLKNCHDIITSSDWKVVKITSDGDVISTMILPKPDGKIFKITGTIELSATKLINDLFDNVESCMSWNKQVCESKKIHVIDDDTDLVYQATTALGNGAIGARDYVLLRHRGKYDSFLINSGVSVNFSVVPSRKNFTRAEVGVSCFATQNLDSTNDRCQFVWLLNTNLKGWIPQKLVDMSMSIGVSEFLSALRLHAITIKE